jgi:hypothetical protein
MLVACAASADTTINTFPSGLAYIVSFHTEGQGGYVTAGQTFTAPGVDSMLSSYTMGLWAYLPWDLGFYSVVQAWDDVNGATNGPALFKSDVIHASNQTTFTTYTFHPEMNLTAGGRYIAYFSTLGVDTNPEFGAFDVRLSQTDAYADGGAWSFNTFENRWQKTIDDGVGHDFRLLAKFTAPPAPSAAPEPATWALTILGFGATGAAVRRRRQRTA